MPRSEAKVISAFRHHGVTLSGSGAQLKGTCPFCQKEGHFYVATATGQWDCKRCGLSGNVYNFLNEWHKVWLEATTPEDYERFLKEL